MWITCHPVMKPVDSARDAMIGTTPSAKNPGKKHTASGMTAFTPAVRAATSTRDLCSLRISPAIPTRTGSIPDPVSYERITLNANGPNMGSPVNALHASRGSAPKSMAANTGISRSRTGLSAIAEVAASKELRMLAPEIKVAASRSMKIGVSRASAIFRIFAGLPSRF